MLGFQILCRGVKEEAGGAGEVVDKGTGVKVKMKSKLTVLTFLFRGADDILKSVHVVSVNVYAHDEW